MPLASHPIPECQVTRMPGQLNAHPPEIGPECFRGWTHCWQSLSFKAVPRGVVRVSVWLQAPRCCSVWSRCAVRWVLVDAGARCLPVPAPLAKGRGRSTTAASSCMCRAVRTSPFSPACRAQHVKVSSSWLTLCHRILSSPSQVGSQIHRPRWIRIDYWATSVHASPLG
jgi:hypothetical protein